MSPFTYGQTPERTLNVGIVIYPGVEILDFSGPCEVFGATSGFNVFTVAYKKDPIISQGIVKVIPEFTIEGIVHRPISCYSRVEVPVMSSMSNPSSIG